MTNLNEQIILITGASSGIGAACARLFASLGARLILCARRSERLTLLSKELVEAGYQQPYLLTLDVSDKNAVQQQLGSLPPEWQAIDVLVNNAGLALDTLPLQDGIIEHWIP